MNKFTGIGGGALVVLGMCAVKACLPEVTKQYCAHPHLQTPNDRALFAEKCGPDQHIGASPVDSIPTPPKTL